MRHRGARRSLRDPIQLSREDWLEIFDAIDSKRRGLEASAYDDPMRGPQRERLEKLDWALDLLRLMDKLGHNGEQAMRRGVQPVSAPPARTSALPASRNIATRAALTPWRAAGRGLA